MWQADGLLILDAIYSTIFIVSSSQFLRRTVNPTSKVLRLNTMTFNNGTILRDGI